MSDEMAEKLTPQSNGTEKKSLSLTITLHPDWTVECDFPTNRLMARGMLSEAQAQLTKLDTLVSITEANAKVQAARGGLSGLVKRMNGGRG